MREYIKFLEQAKIDGEFEYKYDGAEFWDRYPLIGTTCHISLFNFNEGYLRPVPKPRLLVMADITPLTCLRRRDDEGTRWSKPTTIDKEGVYLIGTLINWQELREDYEMSENLTDWSPCEKSGT